MSAVKGAARAGGAVVFGVTLLAAAFLVGVWAERSLVGGPAPSASTGDQTLGIVSVATERTFGRSIPLAVRVRWDDNAEITAQIPVGVVTQLSFQSPAPGSPGDILLAVNGLPVFLLQAESPFYRALERGSKGEDVRALQRFLVEDGVYTGQLDGNFGPSMGEALRQFYVDRGLPTEARAPLGRFVAVPFLDDAHLQVVSDSPVGATSDGSVRILVIKPSSPSMTATVAAMPEVVPGIVVDLPNVDAELIVRSVVPQLDNVDLVLGPRPGGSPATCVPPGCDLALSEDLGLVLEGRLTLLPETTSVSVPAGAVLLRSNGGTYVVEAATGREIDVIVAGRQDGYALISDGLSVGTKVVLE